MQGTVQTSILACIILKKDFNNVNDLYDDTITVVVYSKVQLPFNLRGHCLNPIPPESKVMIIIREAERG